MESVELKCAFGKNPIGSRVGLWAYRCEILCSLADTLPQWRDPHADRFALLDWFSKALSLGAESFPLQGTPANAEEIL